jgi:hypothetical protein
MTMTTVTVSNGGATVPSPTNGVTYRSASSASAPITAMHISVGQSTAVTYSNSLNVFLQIRQLRALVWQRRYWSENAK